jgi:hypothetical protein
MITSRALSLTDAARSPFAGADVCREAGLPLPERAPRPLFDDDLWDLSEVIGLPVSLGLQRRRFDFTPIPSAPWRLADSTRPASASSCAPSAMPTASVPLIMSAPDDMTRVISNLTWLTIADLRLERYCPAASWFAASKYAH